MAQIIGLPKLSPTMEEGVLVRWAKKEGDAVEPGDLVAEVETDKANMDFNLEDRGVLLKQLVAEGETVTLGAPVAILGEAGEDISALVAEASAAKTAAASAPKTAPDPVPAATPPAPPPVPASLAGLGLGPDPAPAPAPAHAPDPAPVPAPGPAPVSGGRMLASPLAKTVAIELGVDLRQIAGSGPGGRIIERDVRRAAAEPPPPPTALALVRGAAGLPATVPPSNDYVDKPLSPVRKRIAQRMTEAKRDVPHYYLRRQYDAAPLMGFRKRLNELLGNRGKVSVNDMVIKGVALALRRVPECNAAFITNTGEDGNETAIRYHARVHVGVAVATERGLITPVVRDADLKGIGVIAREVRDLAERARSRSLKVEEIRGSTFTVSNLGMYGIEEFAAVINPPEAAILALGTVREEPVVVDGGLSIGKRMALTMSCDHRVIDGALGARFLVELADILEHPESLAL